MSRIVLFGAGASYGSGEVLPRVPPLGPDLFEALSRLYPNWRSIPTNLANLFESNFEVGMAEIIEKHGFAIAPLMQEMAIFFSIFNLPNANENRYERLLGSTDKVSSVCWSTLNYECLLELAGVKSSLKIGYFTDPKSSDNENLPVWKLHGSCNFKITGMNATRGVQFNLGAVFNGGIEPIELFDVMSHYSGNTALYPAMALFAAGKPIAMSPSPIHSAQEKWAEMVMSAERIMLIGVNPNMDDRHIWESLTNTDATIGYIGSQTAFETWITDHRRAKQTNFFAERWNVAESNVVDFLNRK
jgi:hypothetical protein